MAMTKLVVILTTFQPGPSSALRMGLLNSAEDLAEDDDSRSRCIRSLTGSSPL
jgi:hypothetical protein